MKIFIFLLKFKIIKKKTQQDIYGCNQNEDKSCKEIPKL